MNLQQLFYLQEAIKYRSISLAAEKNFIAQSTISTSLNALEKELGISLLRRHNKGVTPTEDGQYIADRVQEIKLILSDITEYSQKALTKNIVNISVIGGICYILLPLTMKYLESSPITLSVHTKESHEILHDVASGSSVFGIMIYQDEINESDLKYTSLFQDQYMLYVGANSPLWGRQSITLAEALTQPYIAYKNEFIQNNGSISDKLADMQPNIIFRTDDVESMKQMIMQYPYVSFFSEVMYKNDVYLQHDLIQKIPISDYDMSFNIGYIESKRYKASNNDYHFIKAFKEALEDILSQI